MKRLLIALCLFCALLAAHAQGLDDQYVQIYSEIQQADTLVGLRQAGQAAVLYQEALTGLSRIKAAYPTWNSQVIAYRINYVNEKLAVLRQEPVPAKVSPEAQPTAEPADLAAKARALAEQVRRLEAERAELSAKLKEALTAQPGAMDSGELKKAQDMAVKLQKENDSLKVTLEQTKTQLEAASKGGSKDASKKQIVSLEERLASANTRIDELKKQVSDWKARSKTPGKQDLAQEVESLRARLLVYESRSVPFTPEELAAISQGSNAVVSAPAPALETKTAKKAHRELPPGAGPLMADAERDFQAHRFEPALQKFLQVLSQRDDNLVVLYNVAACQIQLGATAEAEKNVQSALAIDPNDEPSLSLLGTLRYQQNKYDEAFAALSRAVDLEPKDWQAQNMLGATLAQKGQRDAAETAFRKALQVRPDFELAHYNLALIYANQSPPFLHLARFHYQKAIALGHSPDAKLEKLVNP